MSENLDNNGLRSIADKYDIFYIDLWGVVHNGVKLHKNAIEALDEITRSKKQFVLLTNAPRPKETVRVILEKMGMIKEISEKVPRAMRKSFETFAGVQGTPVYEAFKAGTLHYYRYLLKKPE